MWWIRWSRLANRTLGPFVVVLATTLVACSEEAGEDETVSDTTPVTSPDTGRPGPSTGLPPSTGSTSQLTVTNPMPHAMTIRVTYPDGGGRRLGTVAANGTQTFTMPELAGETVTLVATDDAETHAPETTLEIRPGDNAWTIR